MIKFKLYTLIYFTQNSNNIQSNVNHKPLNSCDIKSLLDFTLMLIKSTNLTFNNGKYQIYFQQKNLFGLRLKDVKGKKINNLS